MKQDGHDDQEDDQEDDQKRFDIRDTLLEMRPLDASETVVI